MREVGEMCEEMAETRRSSSSVKCCPLCGSSRLDSFYEMSDVPVYCNRLWPDRNQAISCPRGNIRLAFCQECGFITNADFDPALIDYTDQYENRLHYSPYYRDYAKSLAERLVRHYDLHHKDIIDIGCGKGDFLLLLCGMGNNRGIGFDPGYLESDGHNTGAVDVKFIKDRYCERYSGYRADLVCCRQVLEHVPNPVEFLNTVRVATPKNSNSSLFLEVPNVAYTITNLFIWDIIYEHCSYFTSYSLSHLLSSCGFEVTEVTEEFGGQYLAVDALPGNVSSGLTGHQSRYVSGIAPEIASFERRYRDLISNWKRQLERLTDSGKRAVIWGAGSKGVSFLNILGLSDRIEYAVDINPKKREMYVAGTGQKILSPEALREYKPEVVIVMNPIYKDEIKRMVKELGITPEFVYI